MAQDRTRAQVRAPSKTQRQHQETTVQATPRKQRVHVPYQQVEDAMMEATREELAGLLGIAEDRDEHRFDRQFYIADADEDAPEMWEPEDEERLSDDWDTASHSTPWEEALHRAEPAALWQGAAPERTPLPDVLVEREETLNGPRLHVHLMGIALWLAVSQPAPVPPDRMQALHRRQHRLLEVMQYAVAHQRDFLLQQGPRKLLTQEQVAHVLWGSAKKDDVSRLLRGKWLRTPWDDLLPADSLFPSPRDILLEHIISVLQAHDRLELDNGRIVVHHVIPVDSTPGKGVSLIAELHKRLQLLLGTVEGFGLSPENVKDIMKKAGIPRLARDRKAAYEAGRAWWRSKA